MSHGRSVHQSSRIPPERMTLPGVSGAHWDPGIASFPFLHHRLPHLGAQNHTPPCSHSLVRVQAWCGRAPWAGSHRAELSSRGWSTPPASLELGAELSSLQVEAWGPVCGTEVRVQWGAALTARAPTYLSQGPQNQGLGGCHA